MLLIICRSRPGLSATQSSSITKTKIGKKITKKLMERLRVVVVKIIKITMQNLKKKRLKRKENYVCRRGCDHSHQHIATAASG